MFHHTAWAVGSYNSCPPASPGNISNPSLPNLTPRPPETPCRPEVKNLPALSVEHAEVGELAILELCLPRRPRQRVPRELARPPVRRQQLNERNDLI